MASTRPTLPDAEQLFDEVPCGVLLTAVDGMILRSNATFCRWVGSRADELVDKKRLQDLLTVGARIFHQTHWLPTLQMQGSISEMKFDVRSRDGRTLPMLFNVVRRSTEGGDYDVVTAVIAEERHQYERELLAARKRADSLVLLEQDRALFAEQMIGIVSHDLRNPLSVVLMATRVLSRRGQALSEEKTERMLSNIASAAERSQRLVEDLLDFTVARVGRGLAVNRQSMDLHVMAGEAVEELRVAFPGRTLLHRRAGDGHASADADRLNQLIGNLVGNAMSYGDPAKAVTVTSEVTDGVVRLSVHNDGTPIAPELIGHIFEPMVRGETGEYAARSVGLGLFIVKAIATAHGGAVAVTSTAASGTDFSMTFPALPVA